MSTASELSTVEVKINIGITEHCVYYLWIHIIIIIIINDRCDGNSGSQQSKIVFYSKHQLCAKQVFTINNAASIK